MGLNKDELIKIANLKNTDWMKLVEPNIKPNEKIIDAKLSELGTFNQMFVCEVEYTTNLNEQPRYEIVLVKDVLQYLKG